MFCGILSLNTCRYLHNFIVCYYKVLLRTRVLFVPVLLFRHFNILLKVIWIQSSYIKYISMLNLLVGNEWLPGRMEAEKKNVYIKVWFIPTTFKECICPFCQFALPLKMYVYKHIWWNILNNTHNSLLFFF